MAHNRPADLPAPTDDDDLSFIAPSLRYLAVPIEWPQEDVDNARAHPVRNITAIRQSLREYGQRTPIVVDVETRTVLKGNGTLEAAGEEGWRWIAAVLVRSADQAQGAAYAVTDNRTSDMSEWHMARLRAALEKAASFDMTRFGWTEDELTAAVRGVPNIADLYGNSDGVEAPKPAGEVRIRFLGAKRAEAAACMEELIKEHPEWQATFQWYRG